MSQQSKVLEELIRGGPATAAELSLRLGLGPDAGVSARLSELCRAGKVEKCGFRGKATLWKAVEDRGNSGEY